MNTIPTYYFGSLDVISLFIPNDLVGAGGSGSFDDQAEYFGPILAELNDHVDVSRVRAEMDEVGIEPEKYADDSDLWEYVSWLIAMDTVEIDRDQFIEWDGIEWFQNEDGTWGWWACQPGCLPDGDMQGPFDSAAECIADIAENMSRMEG